jgi:serine/threonine protein kinase
MNIDTVLHNRYKITRFLGSTESGNTYLAEDLDLPGCPQCVVKHFQPKSLTPSLLQAARVIFDRETKVLYDLGKTHNQIPSLFAHFEENGHFYWVQAFVDGHTLTKELISGQAWNEASVVQLLKEILEILTVVHQQGIIHRDIKPQNLIRRQQDKKIVLIDFGAVKAINGLVEDSAGHITSTTPIGAEGYMPPEQSQGHPQLASDIYAVGVLGIQALLGRMPKQDANTGDLLWKDFVSVSPHMTSILDQMTCYHFRDRYTSAQLALSALLKTVVTSPSEPKKIEQLRQNVIPETVVAPQQNAKSPRGGATLIGCLASLIAGFTAITAISLFVVSAISPQDKTATSGTAKTGEPKSLQQSIAEASQENDDSSKKSNNTSQTSSDANSPTLKSATAYIERGLARYKAEDYQGAIKDYDEAIRLNPDDADTFYNRGLARYSSKDNQGAIEDYNEAIRLNPKDADSFYNRGLARYDSDDKEGAIKDYDEAIRLNPKDDTSYFNRAITRRQLGDNQGAIKDYSQAIQLNPKYAKAYYNRGYARYKSGDKQGAIKDYRLAANLFKAQGKTKDYQDAMDAIQALGE